MATRNNAYYTETSAKEGSPINIFQLAGQLGLEELLQQRNSPSPVPQNHYPKWTFRPPAVSQPPIPAVNQILNYDYLLKYFLN